MIKSVNASILAFVAIAATTFAGGCSEDASQGDDDDNNTGGTGATGGTGSTTCGPTEDCLITPTTTGWIERQDNPLGIQGAWYPYGDKYGVPAKCLTVGLHAPEDCSDILTPNAPPAGTPSTAPGFEFTNAGDGKMCTSGAVAVILACKDGVMTEGCPTKDYANQWGAGIGFDLNADKGEDGGAKHTWDPAQYGVIGFAFTLDAIPGPKLRVEIPIELTDEEATAAGLGVHPEGKKWTTDDHPKGAPYLDASSSFPASNLQIGENRVLWSEIKYPIAGAVTFEPKRMLGIQFHVPAVAAPPKGAYQFCISDFKFLRNP